MGCITSKITLLEVILTNSTVSSTLRLLPNSRAAIMVIALASPIPLNCINCDKLSLPNAFKFWLTLANIRLLKSTAVSFLLPDPIKIAINSASLKAFLPLSINFSRGLSSSDQLLMGKGAFSIGVIFMYLLFDQLLDFVKIQSTVISRTHQQ
jgi:hypothetical protein